MSHLLYNALNSNNIPNLLIYGVKGSGKKTQLFQIIKELYNPSCNIYKTRNEIEYSYNDTYYEFNIQNIQTKDYNSLIEIINEIILMGLRTKAGVDASNFYLRTGRNLKEAVNVEALNRLKEGNFLTSDQKGIRTTMAGLLRLNSVIKELVSF